MVLVFFLVIAGVLVLFATEIVPVHITAHDIIVAPLVQTTPESIERVDTNRDFIVTQEIERQNWHETKNPVTTGIVAAVVGLAAIHVLPTAASALASAFAMVPIATLTNLISNNASVAHMIPIAAEAVITLGIYAPRGLQPPA